MKSNITSCVCGNTGDMGLIVDLVPITALPIRPKPSSVTIPPSTAAQIKLAVEHLYRLGPRPVFEAFCAVHGGAGVIETLEAYRRLDPTIVKMLGADQLSRRRPRNGCRRG
jgi:hypothetical protein